MQPHEIQVHGVQNKCMHDWKCMHAHIVISFSIIACLKAATSSCAMGFSFGFSISS